MPNWKPAHQSQNPQTRTAIFFPDKRVQNPPDLREPAHYGNSEDLSKWWAFWPFSLINKILQHWIFPKVVSVAIFWIILKFGVSAVLFFCDIGRVTRFFHLKPNLIDFQKFKCLLSQFYKMCIKWISILKLNQNL